MAARSNPASMHFSRNPPGPNTSCIEGFADSLAGASAVHCGRLPATVGSSSIGTYSRSAVLAARWTFAPEESPAGLDTRFARNPPSLYQPERRSEEHTSELQSQ